MIGFSSDERNKHGMELVKRGISCSLGIWFTHNVSYKEMDQELALEVLEKVILIIYLYGGAECDFSSILWWNGDKFSIKNENR